MTSTLGCISAATGSRNLSDTPVAPPHGTGSFSAQGGRGSDGFRKGHLSVGIAPLTAGDVSATKTNGRDFGPFRSPQVGEAEEVVVVVVGAGSHQYSHLLLFALLIYSGAGI